MTNWVRVPLEGDHFERRGLEYFARDKGEW